MEQRIKELETRVRELESQRDGLLSEFEAALFPGSESSESHELDPAERDELNLLRRLRERFDEALRAHELERAQWNERQATLEQSELARRSKVQDLEERCRSLETQLSETKDASSLMSRLRAELEEARARGKRERVAATEAEAERARLDELVMAMRLEREDLMTSRDEHKARADALEIELRKLGDFAESGQSEQGQLREALTAAQAELEALRSGASPEPTVVEAPSGSAIAELDSLREQLAALEGELQAQRELNARLEAESAADAAGWVDESEAARARERALEEALSASNSRIAELEAQRAKEESGEEESGDRVSKRLEALTDTLEAAQSRIAELESRLQVSENSLRDGDLWITQLERERDQALARIEELSAEVTRTSVNDPSTIKNDEGLAAELAAQAEALEELRARFELERQRAEGLEAQLAAARGDGGPATALDSSTGREDQNAELEVLRAEREALASELDLARERASMVVENLRTQIDELQETLAERDREIAELCGASGSGARPPILTSGSIHEAMIDQLKDDHAMLANSLAESENERGSLALLCEELRLQVAERDAELSRLQTDLEAERSSLDETRLQAEHAAQLREELAQLAQDLAEKSGRLEELESELQRSQDQPSKAMDSAEMLKALASLEEERTRLLADLETQKEAKERLIRSKALLQTQIKREESAREDAQRLLRLKDKALSELRERYEGKK